MKKLLLGSGGFRTPERIAFLTGCMRSHFGSIRRLLFVPYALADHEAYVQNMIDKGIDAGYELDGIHRHADPGAAVAEAKGIFVGGGNTFRLVNELYRHRLIESIRERVAAGLPYLGVSAGSNVACPTLMTTNDMPIIMPPSFKTLGLVPFQINPHYYQGRIYIQSEHGYDEHFGETRDDRIREYHELNDPPVIGLWEGGILKVHGSDIELSGAPARLFRKGRPPVDLAPGARLHDHLSEPDSD